MKRKKLRRLLRAAEAAQMTVAQYLAWKNRGLPDDHPRSEKRPMLSDEQLGRRMISVVERSGTLPTVERKMHRRLGRKRHLNAMALLVGVELAAYLMGTYHRSAVCSVLNGLHPNIAKELGLVDHNGCPIIVKYKVVQSTLKWLERRLRWGWYAHDVRCDLAWIANAMIAASVPRRVRRTATAVVLDSTPVEGYAVPRVFTKQADLNKAAKARIEEATRLENDPYAKHRRDVLKDPDLPEPEEMKGYLAAVAKKLGIKVGTDGRIIRGKDPDMRAGWASATKKRKAHFFVGYDAHVVSLCRSIQWQGNPRSYQLSPKVPLYVVALMLVPAGTNPGPVGYDAVMRARAIAPNIREVIADRAYTLKRESFLRPLHEEKINVVMDYPKRMIAKADPTTLGKRQQSAINNCGTIIPDWVESNQYTLPEELRSKYPAEPDKEQRRELTKEQRKELRNQQDKARQNWYADRAKEHRYSTNGTLRKNTRDPSTRPMLCPVHAGRAATPTKAASYKVPLSSTGGGACCNGQVSAYIDELDFYQDHPYGTPVWWKSYHRRSTVESVIGKLKDLGLGDNACKAFGLAANTLAAVAIIVTYNKLLTDKRKHKKRKKKAKKLAKAVARLIAPTSQPTPEAQPEASDGEAPPRAPP